MVPAWIVDSGRLASSDARVLLELCRHQNWTTHQCYRSIPRLARDMRLSKDTVRTARKHLVEIGAIQPRGVHPRLRTDIWEIIYEPPAEATDD